MCARACVRACVRVCVCELKQLFVLVRRQKQQEVDVLFPAPLTRPGPGRLPMADSGGGGGQEGNRVRRVGGGEVMENEMNRTHTRLW